MDEYKINTDKYESRCKGSKLKPPCSDLLVDSWDGKVSIIRQDPDEGNNGWLEFNIRLLPQLIKYLQYIQDEQEI